MGDIEPTEDCCKVWGYIIHRFKWMAHEGAPTLLTMPHMAVAGQLWRVNHCPSCGKEVRYCVIEAERLV
jgi:hypothetical protein